MLKSKFCVVSNKFVCAFSDNEAPNVQDSCNTTTERNTSDKLGKTDAHYQRDESLKLVKPQTFRISVYKFIRNDSKYEKVTLLRQVVTESWCEDRKQQMPYDYCAKFCGAERMADRHKMVVIKDQKAVLWPP